MAERRINIPALARVEGEGALEITLREGAVEEVHLRIYEPPRFFEGILRGRHFHEVPDIVARICGICPVAYQMSAVHALEAALGIAPPENTRALRRLLYCGEWIESHALHLYLLAAPDFFGYGSALEMAKDHREIVERGLRLKATGNALIAAVGGRSIHPVSPRVGGFSGVPRRGDLRRLLPELERAREAAMVTVRWAAGWPIPEHAWDFEYAALVHQEEYPMNEGRFCSSGGVDCAMVEFDTVVQESQIPHSNALHAAFKGRGAYLVGPLARINLNAERLAPGARAALRESGIPFPTQNPFYSHLARAVEMLHAVEEALRIIEEYAPPDPPCAETPDRAGEGRWITEAPRGSLYHHYRIGPDGLIESARIVPPTSQNQRQIEEDLRAYLPKLLDLPDEALGLRCEALVRAYDPCISCATHFLSVTIKQRQ